MQKLNFKGLCIFLAVFLMAASTARTEETGRGSLSLDGTWNFATDPDKTGEAEQWFLPGKSLPKMPREGYAPEADGTIQVPGVWDNQGYGAATDKVRHNFVGCGWYKKTAAVPAEWSGKKIFLKLGGISRYAKGWVNGKPAGDEILGFIGENEWDVTSLFVPGEASEITLCVDSKQRWEIEAAFGCASRFDFADIEWGGLWGHVTLEARSESYIDSFLIRSDIKTGMCTAEASFVNSEKTSPADRLRLTALDAANNPVAETFLPLTAEETAGGTFEKNIAVTVPDAKLWTPERPVLYRFVLSLCRGETVLDTLAVRTGIREIKTIGGRILLNGNDIFLRGYGDDHVYPIEFAMPADKRLHLERLALIKSYGFNHVRHHSSIMPQEYYDACDEIGMLTNGEFLIDTTARIPGDDSPNNTWKKKVPVGTDPKPALQFYVASFEKMVKQYRNHPSIIWWAGGNELIMLGRECWLKSPLRGEFQKAAKRFDPDRLFIDCDGDWKKRLNDSLRDTQDLYPVQFEERVTSPVKEGELKFKMPPYPKPMLAHETGNYCSFARTDQYELFDRFTMSDGTIKQSNFIPFWMTDGMKKMATLGFAAESAQWSDASEKLYFITHKYNIEGLRLNPNIVGYHWWLFQDYWETSNGLVDYFFRPKPGIDPADLRRLNSETIVLQRGLPRTARSGETLKITTLLSNFSTVDIGGKQTVTLSFGDQKETRAINIPVCPKAALTQTDTVELMVPDLAEPVPARLTVRVESENGTWDNSWNCRLFPRNIKPKTEKPVVAGRKDLLPKDWNARLLSDDVPLSKNAVYVVEQLESDVAAALLDGAGVVLTDREFLPGCSMTYKQSWWKAGETADHNNCGTFVYDHPILKKLVDDNWCDVSWHDLIEGAGKMDLAAAPSRPDMMIRALPSILRVEDTALLFAVRVGKGTLVVSGLNHQASVGRPENEQLLANMIDFAASSDKPKTSWNPDFFILDAKIPEGTVLGYKRVLNSSERVTGKSFRRETASQFLCRQNSKNSACAWMTDNVINDSETATFVFAGGLGFSSQPKTKGFSLAVNGADVLNFDLPQEGQKPEWTSDSGVRLCLDVVKKEEQDSFGIFRLTVPKSLLKLNERQMISVRSLGEGSRRWFSLTPEKDLVRY